LVVISIWYLDNEIDVNHHFELHQMMLRLDYQVDLKMLSSMVVVVQGVVEVYQ
jgi:hypothetical protein